jgi:hypothetical protein
MEELADEWAGTWCINDASTDALKAKIMQKGGSNRFTLAPIYSDDNGLNLVYLVVPEDDGAMNESWTNCYLLRRGGAKVLSFGGPPLPAWVPPPPDGSALADRYKEAVSTAVPDPTMVPFDTQRIEGDITVNGVKESVALYQVPEAIDDGKTLLIINVLSDLDRRKGQLHESGTAHGNT